MSAWKWILGALGVGVGIGAYRHFSAYKTGDLVVVPNGKLLLLDAPGAPLPAGNSTLRLTMLDTSSVGLTGDAHLARGTTIDTHRNFQFAAASILGRAL
jgi:hypothetical protein